MYQNLNMFIKSQRVLCCCCRVINRAPGLKLVVQTLLSSLQPIGNIVLICCTFFIIFGILGVQVRPVRCTISYSLFRMFASLFKLWLIKIHLEIQHNGNITLIYISFSHFYLTRCILPGDHGSYHIPCPDILLPGASKICIAALYA